MAQARMMSNFWRGVREAAPFLVMVIPFAILFGVIATEAGLTPFEALSFSVVVIAGAAQFTAVQLLSEQVPTLVVLVSALAVNLRMAMYSATLTPHLGHLPLWQRGIVAYFLIDQTFALAVLQYEKRPTLTPQEKLAYFLGTCVPLCLPWYLSTLVGAWMGEAIPAEMGLDFVLPLVFLSMVGPALHSRAHQVAAATATVLALAMAWLPFNLGLMVGGIGGMMAGAEVERRATLAKGEPQ